MSSIFSTCRRSSLVIAAYSSGSTRSISRSSVIPHLSSGRRVPDDALRPPMCLPGAGLERPDLLPAARMPAALGLRVDERVDDALRQLHADHALPQPQQVHLHFL